MAYGRLPTAERASASDARGGQALPQRRHARHRARQRVQVVAAAAATKAAVAVAVVIVLAALSGGRRGSIQVQLS